MGGESRFLPPTDFTMKELLIEEDSPGLTDVPGFRVSGVACDIRELGNDRLDLALVASTEPCAAAAVFTRNRVRAAPVDLSRELLGRGDAFFGIVANSGNANACTGGQGMTDAKTMGRLAEQGIGAPPGSVFVCSTGRIGRALPMDRVEAGIREAAGSLAATPEQGARAADAILTSDTCRKTVTVRFDYGGKTVTVAGMAKGAGMIEPNMATMLAFIGTDMAAPAPVLQEMLSAGVAESYNAITVDGDMSTNDTVILLANGKSGVALAEGEGELAGKFRQALRKVNDVLAEKIVSDGEKITKVVEVLVTGATGAADAEKVARTIGNSLLVKSSWYGEDPNWGRLASAAGASGAVFDPDRLDLYYNDVPVLAAGTPRRENEARWRDIVRAKRFTVRLDLNAGEGRFRLLATDLTEGYVAFNKTE